VILVTVGTDGPFDRLIRTVDEWAGSTGRADVIAQIGKTTLVPKHIKAHEFFDPPQFREYFSEAELIIAHAGMGTILSALRYQKPLLVMPRRASLGEQRNEHQLATARHLQEMGKVTVAFDEKELVGWLAHLQGLTAAQGTTSPFASPALTDAIRDFIVRPRR
jgi:UDP-N-acetylglucosamine transferase subunit ALG13